MHKNVSLLSFFIVTILPLAVTAQEESSSLEFAGYQWRVAARQAEVVNHLGREALRLGAGRVIADDIVLINGVIRFDAAFTEQQSFIGAGWRAENDQNFEEMYFRAHLNNDPDTLQYTPVYNGLSAWQMFYDGQSIAPLQHRYGEWNEVKIVVDGDSAEIFYNSEEPALHISKLDRNPVSGAINLRVTGQGSEPVYFSNFSVSQLSSSDRITPQAMEDISLPAGLITHWQVSAPFGEEEVSVKLNLASTNTENLDWQTMAVGEHGFVNLAKLHPATPDHNTVWLRTNISVDSPQPKEMLFGYSDRVRIYLNGKRLYTGIGGWRIRNYSFMGLVSFHDAVVLNLNTGNNELLIAVSETFGGWGWGAAID